MFQGASIMKTNKIKKDKYLTTSQLANILGISRIAIHKKIKKGDIKAIRIGHIYAIPTSYVSVIHGRKLSSQRKKLIEKAVHKAVEEYGEVLLKLGNE
jgi:excisionase family DNA binding protein